MKSDLVTKEYVDGPPSPNILFEGIVDTFKYSHASSKRHILPPQYKFRPGELITIGARTGQGKSFLTETQIRYTLSQNKNYKIFTENRPSIDNYSILMTKESFSHKYLTFSELVEGYEV